MKQISVTIPNNKEALFIELMNNLSYVKKVEPIEKSAFPEWHKTIIDERMENFKNNPESYRNWDEVQKEIDQKYGL